MQATNTPRTSGKYIARFVVENHGHRVYPLKKRYTSKDHVAVYSRQRQFIEFFLNIYEDSKYCKVLKKKKISERKITYQKKSMDDIFNNAIDILKILSDKHNNILHRHWAIF